MKLWDMLEFCTYDTRFDIYVTNAFDQNFPVGNGTAEELRADSEVFDQLMDVVVHYEIATDGEIIILVKDTHYNEPLQKQYRESYASTWSDNDPDSRPFRFMTEVRNKHIRNKRKTK